MYPVLVQAAVGERIGRVAGFFQVRAGERVGVDNEVGAVGQVLQVGFQRRRVHGHQHVRGITGRENVVV